jgi:hypothetical protein
MGLHYKAFCLLTNMTTPTESKEERASEAYLNGQRKGNEGKCNLILIVFISSEVRLHFQNWLHKKGGGKVMGIAPK